MMLVVPDGMVVRVSSKNRPGYHWAVDEGIEGYLMSQPEMFKENVKSNGNQNIWLLIAVYV